MADQVYGLTQSAAKLLTDMANKHRQRLPDTGRRTRRVPESDGGTRGVPTIMFTIVDSYFCGSCYARARVLSKPVGVRVTSLPDVEGDGPYFVNVYDKTYPTSGFLNEPPEDLLNRVGFAVYLDALEDGPCPDTNGPRWHIFSLVCASEPCGV